MTSVTHTPPLIHRTESIPKAPTDRNVELNAEREYVYLEACVISQPLGERSLTSPRNNLQDLLNALGVIHESLIGRERRRAA